ncbi:hypothetical protein ACFWN7_11620 [Agromyces sp. NPDC058484]|uniref:hypothetical protein n=1 Tax=Agromyces sp. NPDC058484 TaxID=3346524 RepID=UPI00364FF67F
MSTESMPTRVIWWGVGVAIGGALLIVAAPAALNAWWAPNTQEWQSAMLVFDIVMQIARILFAPLGAALIAAGLVMRYVDRRLRGEHIADRPRRWRWPDEANDGA